MKLEKSALARSLLKLPQITGRKRKKAKKVPKRDIFKPVIDRPHPSGVRMLRELDSMPDDGKSFLSTMGINKDKSNDPGTQKVYRFNNGYGASVVDSVWIHSGLGPEGCELAIVKFKDDEDHNKFERTYETEITDDVMQGLNELEVMEVLIQISKLEPV